MAALTSCENALLFCTPTWASHHVVAKQELEFVRPSFAKSRKIAIFDTFGRQAGEHAGQRAGRKEGRKGNEERKRGRGGGGGEWEGDQR